MRLFTGISLPAEITGNLARLLEHLRPVARLRWSQPYNLHVTTKFIGEWPDERVSEIVERLQPLARRAPIQISAEGIGWLPNPHSPRVLFVAVKAGPELAQLAKDTDDAVAGLGIERESRAYNPHLTLARIKDPATPLAQLRQAIAGLKTVEFGAWTAGSFKLYLSKLGPSGSIYTQLAEFPFTE